MNGNLFPAFLTAQQKIRDEHVRLSRKFIEDGVKLLSNEQRPSGYFSTAAFTTDDPGLNDGYVLFTLKVKTAAVRMRVKRLPDDTFSVGQGDHHLVTMTDPAQLVDYFYGALVAAEEAHTRLVLGLDAL